MANPVFPTLSNDERIDSSKFSVDAEDPASRSEMEGGYVVSRARHTRRPRRTFSCAYTYITTADRDLIASFYDQMRGGSVIFDWTCPQDGNVYSVRFKGAVSEQYVGRGTNQRWDVSFRLEQA